MDHFERNNGGRDRISVGQCKKLLLGAENERMDWANHDQIQRLRVKHAQKHDGPPKKQPMQLTTAKKLRYCGLYQRGTCQEKGDHAGQKHMCIIGSPPEIRQPQPGAQAAVWCIEHKHCSSASNGHSRQSYG